MVPEEEELLQEILTKVQKRRLPRVFREKPPLPNWENSWDWQRRQVCTEKPDQPGIQVGKEEIDGERLYFVYYCDSTTSPPVACIKSPAIACL